MNPQEQRPIPSNTPNTSILEKLSAEEIADNHCTLCLKVRTEGVEPENKARAFLDLAIVNLNAPHLKAAQGVTSVLPFYFDPDEGYAFIRFRRNGGFNPVDYLQHLKLACDNANIPFLDCWIDYESEFAKHPEWYQ